jgi:cyanophycinase-like exopeptidase
VRKPVTLIAGQRGDAHFGTRPYLRDALQATGARRPRALYIGAANGNDRGFGEALCVLLTMAGAERVLWPKLEGRRKRAQAVAALENVDFVFVGGGDVEGGMRALRDADLVDPLRAAAAHGTVFAGMSAGSIMLGKRWIRWPHARAKDDEAETYECLGVAECSLDTHGEGDGWSEARAFASVRATELGRKAYVYGVPSGAALLASPGGQARALGAPATLFAAAPRGRATVDSVLEVAS